VDGTQPFVQLAFFNRMAGRNFLEESNGGGMQIDAELVSPNLFAALGMSA
jgi:hypothetical protein